ncbi:MarR family winged helix-turn-helix transcriptional regulator [Virgisporangium ochraceum]|uniref:MarR family transcriptional regulator n=1 Tax=Virgisporangium ochraceum TaxID=65505 RepID=A0A8J4A3L7_9ACTN|nr:MarR family winged helix-turn-helix transcriptional regulator [Virgisporangium ochraceum]GIJ73613.1 MarR family transcriptional regulator [Virgisporangium ochraceum]
MSEDVHPNVGVLLFIAYRSMEQRVLEALAGLGYDITLAQARLFMRIAPHGSRQTDLAEQAQITKQSAGFLIEALEKAGYVERVPDPTDARARLVRVAAHGARAVETSRKVVDEILAEWTDHLGADRMRAMTDALVSLREITDPYR